MKQIKCIISKNVKHFLLKTKINKERKKLSASAFGTCIIHSPTQFSHVSIKKDSCWFNTQKIDGLSLGDTKTQTETCEFLGVFLNRQQNPRASDFQHSVFPDVRLLVHTEAPPQRSSRLFSAASFPPHL